MEITGYIYRDANTLRENYINLSILKPICYTYYGFREWAFENRTSRTVTCELVKADCQTQLLPYIEKGTCYEVKLSIDLIKEVTSECDHISQTDL